MNDNTHNAQSEDYRASELEAREDEIISLPDFGNIDIPELDLSAFDFMPDEVADTENRYIKPRLVTMKQEQIAYDNAVQMARDTKLEPGGRFDVLASGSFIFGDFIEAYVVTHNIKCLKMTISTLSLSPENVESLRILLTKNYVDELNLVISDYFYSHERHNMVPYLYHRLDVNNKFQLAVTFVHTKTCQFETLGGKKIVMHGSANLRSSGNIEQFTMEDNAELYDFYDRKFNEIIETYGTIRKTINRPLLWDIIEKRQFNIRKK